MPFWGKSSSRRSASFPISKPCLLSIEPLRLGTAEVWLGPASSHLHDAELVGRFRTAREARGRGWPVSFPSADGLWPESGGGASADVWGFGRRPPHFFYVLHSRIASRLCGGRQAECARLGLNDKGRRAYPNLATRRSNEEK